MNFEDEVQYSVDSYINKQSKDYPDYDFDACFDQQKQEIEEATEEAPEESLQD